MISLICCRLWRYVVIVEDIFNDAIYTVPFSKSWEKEVKLSVPVSKRNGSIVRGVPSAWLKWREFLFAITSSVISRSSMVLNSKLGVFWCSSSLYFHLLGCQLFVRRILLSDVKYLILFHIIIICSIFCIFTIVKGLVNLFSFFITEACYIRCCVLNSLEFVLFFQRWGWVWRRSRFILAKIDHSMLIGNEIDDK